MLFILLVMVVIIAVTLFVANQGLFSGLIMAVLTVCCAAVAFTQYEWVAANWIAPIGWKVGFAAPVALAFLFAIPLSVLRTVFDKLVSRACLLPTWIDRIGGGVCGLITGVVTAGVFAAALEMVPLHQGNILGFQRVAYHTRERAEDGPQPKPPPADEAQREIWFQPDRVAVSLAGHLSDGLFSGTRSFAQDNADFMTSIGWTNSAPAVATRFAPPGSIRFVRSEPVRMVYRYEKGKRKDDPPIFEPIEPKAGREFIMVRIALQKEARLGEKSHIFSLRQVQLAGREGDDLLHRYHAIAIQQEEDVTPNRHIKMEANGQWGDWPVDDLAYQPRVGNQGEIEVVFEVPKNFEPEFVEYKRFARAAVKTAKKESSNEGGSGDSGSAPSSTTTTNAGGNSSGSRTADSGDTSGGRRARRSADRGNRNSGGNIRGVAAGTGSAFSEDMPLTLSDYTERTNTEVSRGKLVDGHLIAFLDSQDDGTKPEVKQFEVPDDKRLLHLRTDKLQARSGIGRMITGAVEAVQNFFVEDDAGNSYKVVGKYAEATVDGRRVFEVQYFSSPVGSTGGMGKFQRIKNDDLKGDYVLCYLFLVDPGAKIVRFSTGGSATRADDISDQNLVAPG